MLSKHFLILLIFPLLLSCKQTSRSTATLTRLDKKLVLNTSFSSKDGVTLPFQMPKNFHGFISNNLLVRPFDDSVRINAIDTGRGTISLWNDKQDTFFKVSVRTENKTIDSDLAYGNSLLNNRLPSFELSSIEPGKSITEKDFKNRVSVINIWYNGCEWCEKEIPELNELAEEFDGQNVRFYSACKDTGYIKDNKAFFALVGYDNNSTPYIKEFNQFEINSTSLINAEKQKSSFNIIGYPKTLVVDQEGFVRYIHNGYKDNIIQELRSEILFLQKLKRVQ